MSVPDMELPVRCYDNLVTHNHLRVVKSPVRSPFTEVDGDGEIAGSCWAAGDLR